MSGDEKTTVTQWSSRRKAAVLSVWRESTASEGRSPPRAPWNWWSGAPVRHSGFPHNDRALDRPLWMSDVIPETTFIWRRGQRHRQLGHSRELKLAACNRFHELGMLPVGLFETAEAKRPTAVGFRSTTGLDGEIGHLRRVSRSVVGRRNILLIAKQEQTSKDSMSKRRMTRSYDKCKQRVH